MSFVFLFQKVLGITLDRRSLGTLWFICLSMRVLMLHIRNPSPFQMSVVTIPFGKLSLCCIICETHSALQACICVSGHFIKASRLVVPPVDILTELCLLLPWLSSEYSSHTPLCMVRNFMRFHSWVLSAQIASLVCIVLCLESNYVFCWHVLRLTYSRLGRVFSIARLCFLGYRL